ncbi:MAG: hypothetical protein KDA92_17810, partial [Planctomycetales bacterium]|nr:hypothetical protein [Planctomycetales bacterium]
MTTPPKSPSTPRPLLLGLIGVLAVWGIYQTVGATGWFADRGLFDARRSVIVFACSGAFVAWWIWLLRSLRQAAPTDPGTGDAMLTNYASVVSLGLNLAAWPLWVFAASAWQQNPENGLTMPL